MPTKHSARAKGERVDDGVELSSKSYYSMKLPKTINRLEDILAKLQKYGLKGVIIPVNDDYLTLTGGLRSRGWKIRVWGNDELLDSLCLYSRVLEREYGKGGFRYFSNGNMKKI